MKTYTIYLTPSIFLTVSAFTFTSFSIDSARHVTFTNAQNEFVAEFVNPVAVVVG